jgi:enoyl-CoA hydratase
VSISEGVATIWLDNGPVNVLTTSSLTALKGAVVEIGKRADVRAAILAGKNKGFSAGADLNELAAFAPAQAKKFSLLAQTVAATIESAPLPIVAVIHGFALGAGLELALACDLRISTYGALMGFPQVHFGILPGAGATYRLPRLIGEGKARVLLLTGAQLGAKEAYRLGVVDELFDEEFLHKEAAKVAARFFEAESHAQAQLKRHLCGRVDVEAVAKDFSACFGGPQRERMKAFLK